ncbi:RmlC-like cupin [Myriangium duriaei CBS 260.36]|uniref:RmlC-like cupin n=1 Tax=Myriangium duriaei CBS 260.36 TaxID=1168546 RepID=A0A9P4MIP5_9PEZI|nr:RmlC-like cupin [Myriangium duriaei CBS 260.36]
MATTTTSSISTAAPPFTITKRPSSARGHADHGWLYTFHTFSFASYYSPEHQSFGPLRVINEDRVARGTGFGTHAHREFHIWSYIVSGELEHKDSMGNLETLHRGEVQYTCAGTGIRHSEYNRNEELDNHFLQIWAKPSVGGLEPRYRTRRWGDEEKRDRLVRIMESKDRIEEKQEGPIVLEADLSMDASILSPGRKVVHEIVAEGKRNVYLHVVMGGRSQPKTGGARVRIGNETLGEGDGAFIRVPAATRRLEVESVGEKPAEFLLFDMGLD